MVSFPLGSAVATSGTYLAKGLGRIHVGRAVRLLLFAFSSYTHTSAITTQPSSPLALVTVTIIALWSSYQEDCYLWD